MIRGNHGWKALAALGIFLFMAGPWIDARTAGAASYVVTNLNDGGSNSLRQAVLDANGNPDADNVIRFSGDLGGTITLTSGEIVITKSLTVIGPGPRVLTISGNNTSRVFHINGTDFDIAISGLTIANGRGYNIAQSKYDVGGAIYIFGGGSQISLLNMVIENSVSGAGGGIYASGSTITLTDSTVRSNQVLSNSVTNPHGGGLNFNGSSAIITGSTISGNYSSLSGGGIYGWGGTLNISNTTVSGNTSDGISGGGIETYNEENRLMNVTITGNTASFFGAGITNGSFDDTDTTSITNSIISANMKSGPTEDNCRLSALITVSGGGNIDSGNTCGLSGAGDQQNTDPALGPLADNGGLTLTHGISAGSPAVSGGVASGAPSTDQRGWPRPAGAAVDSGAVEYRDSRTLTVNKTGSTGTGRVMSTPAGLDCGITCTTDASTFPLSGTVSLYATPAGLSIFNGWSGTGCSGLTTMDTDRTCTATFALCVGDPVETASGSQSFASISQGYDAAIQQDQPLRVTASNRIEDLNLFRTVNLVLYGGYDCSLQNPVGLTYISGRVTVGNNTGQTGGSVTMDGIVIL